VADAEPRPVANAKRRPEKTPPFRALAGILIPPVSAIAKLEIIDGAKVPTSGAVIISPNHINELDPVLVGYALWRLGRAPHFLAKASLFTVPVLGWFLRKTGQVAVERAGTARGSDPLAEGRRLTAEGLAVVVYPEGSLTRQPDLWPMRGKSGAVRLALENNIPLVPVAHWGDHQIMQRYGKKLKLFPRRTVRVKFGDPVDLGAFLGPHPDSATLNEATNRVMLAITELLADLRGETPPERLWNPAEHNQTEIGRFD
jgi:1-acyl-sn-glycerol-3-phosphate acyltransferase